MKIRAKMIADLSKLKGRTVKYAEAVDALYDHLGEPSHYSACIKKLAEKIK